MDVKDRLKRQYNEFAEQCDSYVQGVDRLLSEVTIPQAASVLDVGCGTGALTFRLPGKESLRRVVGVDISDKEIDIACRHAAELQLPNFEFQCADACCLPFPDNQFDVVLSNIVLHLIPDVEGALAEIHRVLKPGCKAYLQCQKGDEVAPEMMAIVRRAWAEVLGDRPFPDLFAATTPERIGRCLSALPVEEFQISWLRVTQKVPTANLARFLDFLRLVIGFWRWGLEEASVDKIEHLVSQHAHEAAKATGWFLHTGNLLLIRASKKPS